jgi:predicted transcriptional regulator
MKVLHVQVAEPMVDMLDRARVVMEALEAGREPPAPYFGIGFESMPQMLAVFTPKRLALIAYLSEHGPMTVAALARGLGRDYKNVHGDVAALMEWMVVERGADGRVCVPWEEIDLRLPLARHAA